MFELRLRKGKKKWEGDKEADLKICLIIFSHSILSFKFWKESGKKMKKRR